MRLSKLRPGRRPRLPHEPLLLGQRNIYVLPTRWGFGFGGLVLLLLLISTNYNNNLGFFLAFLLAAIALASAVHGQRNLSGLALRHGQASPIFLGDTLRYTLQLANASSRPRFALTFSAQACEDTLLPRLDAHSDAAVPLSAMPERRGWHQLGFIVLESRYPLGLFRIWSRFSFDWQGLVYPAPAESVKPFPMAADDSASGIDIGEEDFSGFRAYQAGDSLKHVHWKGYAKGRGLFTRIYRHGGIQEQLWLDWNLTDEIGVETKLSRLCRWILEAEQTGHPYGLRLPGLEILPDRGSVHRDACLEALALFMP